MTTVLEIHLVAAYLVAVLALFVGWVPVGRRVMVAIIGLQVLIGAIAAGVAGANHLTLPKTLALHVIAALLAMAFYIVGRRVGDRGATVHALVLSALGFITVIATIVIGMRMSPNYLHG